MIETQDTTNGLPQRRPTAREAKLLIGGLVVVLAVAYLILTAVRGSTAYYLTVAELQAQPPSERNVRVAGTIVEQSIIWETRDLVLQFEIADESGSLPVVYHGARPDMFGDGAEVVVEGRYTPQGIFQAQSLLLKCPSKYEEASTGD